MKDQDDLKAIRRYLALLVQLKLSESRGDKSLTEMIQILDGMGCGPSEIASLLSTTTATVNPVLSRARSKKARK